MHFLPLHWLIVIIDVNVSLASEGFAFCFFFSFFFFNYMTCVDGMHKGVRDTSGLGWQGRQRGSQQPESVCHTERRSFRGEAFVAWNKRLAQTQSLDKRLQIQMD